MSELEILSYVLYIFFNSYKFLLTNRNFHFVNLEFIYYTVVREIGTFIDTEKRFGFFYSDDPQCRYPVPAFRKQSCKKILLFCIKTYK